MTSEELLGALRTAVDYFWHDKPDDTIVSIGTWSTPVPGWHDEFNAQLKLTVGDIRSATSGIKKPPNP